MYYGIVKTVNLAFIYRVLYIKKRHLPAKSTCFHFSVFAGIIDDKLANVHQTFI